MESLATKEIYFSLKPCQEKDLRTMGKNHHTVTFVAKKFWTLDRVITLVVIQKLIVTMMYASTASKERKRRYPVKLVIKTFAQF